MTDAETLARHAEMPWRRVTVDDSITDYCVAIAAATRSHPHALVGSSPRGSLALMLTSRAFAVIDGRDFVTPEDVKAVARAGPRPSDHHQARAVDEQCKRGDRGRGRAEDGADAGRW